MILVAHLMPLLKMSAKSHDGNEQKHFFVSIIMNLVYLHVTAELHHQMFRMTDEGLTGLPEKT